MVQACENIYIWKLVRFRGGALAMEWKAIVMGMRSGMITIKNTVTAAIQEVPCNAVY